MKKTATIILSASLLLWACTSVNVYREISKTADFNQYNTFALAKSDQGPIFRNELADNTFKDLIISELTLRGLELNTKNPDLLVSYSSDTRIQQRTYHNYNSPFIDPFWGWGGAWGGWYGFYGRGFFPGFFNPGFFGGPSFGYSYTDEAEIGKIVIELTDRETNRVVWRGTAEGDADNPKEISRMLKQSVGKLFESFPKGVETVGKR